MWDFGRIPNKNEAWDLVKLLAGRNPLAANGCSRRRQMQKGRWRNKKLGLVAKGYSQVPGIDFGDIFSPIAKVTSIRLLLSVAAAFDF